MPRVLPVVPLALLACLIAAASAAAQGLPTEPVSLAGGRVVFGGEVFVTAGQEDPGWFNYTDYEYSAFRNVRASLSTEVRGSRRLQLLAEVRLDHGEHLSAYALFARIRPWPDRRFDIQVGRVPPTFGAFGRTVYAYDNVVIGQPVAYQYLVALRPDAVPASADDLVRVRGSGWRFGFPVGNTARAPGVPLVNANRFDTGVQVHGVSGPIEWTGAITTGSLSVPRTTDDNGRPQLSGRVAVRPGPAVRLGVSAARGPWLDRALDPVLPGGQRAHQFHQSALGLDAEVSAGAWIARMEWIRSAWQLPQTSSPLVPKAVIAHAAIVEARYRVWPGVSLAGRGDLLRFDEVMTSTGLRTWEAPVRRLETALTVAVTRNVSAKLGWQRNWRDGGRVRHDSLLATQLVYWF